MPTAFQRICDWADAHEDELSKHLGEWVAIGTQGILAHGRLEAVLKKAKEVGLKNVMVEKIPGPDERVF